MAVISPAFSVIANPFSIGLVVLYGQSALYILIRQNQIMEQAILEINAYLDGDRNARIECDNEANCTDCFIPSIL